MYPPNSLYRRVWAVGLVSRKSNSKAGLKRGVGGGVEVCNVDHSEEVSADHSSSEEGSGREISEMGREVGIS